MNLKIDTSQYDDTCYIIGGGTSLIDFDWSLLNDKFVIAINNAYYKLPEAQIVYFTDDPWWELHKKDLLQHKGKLIKGSLPNNKFKHEKVTVCTLTGFDGLETAPMSLKHGSNSAYAALNLAAVHLGFKKIYLLGIDMKWGQKGNKSTSHWHNSHKRIDAETVYIKMKNAYKSIKQPLINMGVEVINVNTPEQTDLDEFPIQTIEETFGKST